jgi:hypothetical protein
MLAFRLQTYVSYTLKKINPVDRRCSTSVYIAFFNPGVSLSGHYLLSAVA